MAFRGSINGGLVFLEAVPGPVGWVGEASFTFGTNDAELDAKTVTINTGLKKGVPGSGDKVTIGTEETIVDFGNGIGRFKLVTRFVTQHGNKTESWVNETGTIVPIDSDGTFADVRGQYTLHGPFGPFIPQPDLTGYVPLGLGWLGEFHGTICGFDPTLIN